MLVPGSHKPLVLKKTRPDTHIHEVAGVDIFTPGPIFSAGIPAEKRPSLKVYKSPSLSKIFAIKFSYLQQLHYTKVLKVSHGYDDPFYKVMLGSNINTGAPICWLQHQLQGWAVLLGNELDERLKQAIAFAIEYQEELGLI